PPAEMLTVMVAESPAAVPAAPRKPGVPLLVTAPLLGAVRVTAGGVVSTVKVAALLSPVLPAASDCCACAVYVPSASAGAATTDQAPALAVAVSVSTGVPVALPPA